MVSTGTLLLFGCGVSEGTKIMIKLGTDSKISRKPAGNKINTVGENIIDGLFHSRKMFEIIHSDST